MENTSPGQTPSDSRGSGPRSSGQRTARLVARRELAFQTVEYVLGHGDPELRFRPGQFISVRVGTDADDNPILRSYSLASPPERRGELTLILRLIDGGIGSEFFKALRIGDELPFTGPMGFFVNELAHAGDVVYVATGTGVAPMLPMIEEVLARPETGRVFLFWGLRNQDDVFWHGELQALADRNPRFVFQIYLSQPRSGWSKNPGYVTGPVVELLPNLKSPTFYLCGNGHMIRDVKAQLTSRGVERKRQIRTEAYFE